MPNSKTSKKNNTKKIDFKNIEQLLKINILDSDLLNVLSASMMPNEKELRNFNENILGGDSFTNLVENMKLKRVSISNFKSIKNESFDLNEATVLSGKNSAGKSSFTHAVLLLAQWLGGYADTRPGYMPLNGEFIKLGNSSDIYYSEANEEHAKGTPTFKTTEPINISLVFIENDNNQKDREYAINFSFLPVFKKLDKSETKTIQIINPNKKVRTVTNIDNVKIMPAPELELISLSTKLTFKNDIFKQDFIRDILISTRGIEIPKESEFFKEEIKNYMLLNMRKESTKEKHRNIFSSKFFENEILEFKLEYKKLSIDSNVLNAKNFLGSYLTNFVNSHKFSFGIANSGKMNLILKSTKFGDNVEKNYLISPYGLTIGGLKLSNDINKPNFEEIIINEWFSDFYKLSIEKGVITRKKEIEKIDRYIKETSNTLSLQRIIPGNSFAVSGDKLVKIRLLTDLVNTIQSEDSPLIKEFIDKNYEKNFDRGTLLETNNQKNKLNIYKKLLQAIDNNSKININDETLDQAYGEKGIEPFVWFLNKMANDKNIKYTQRIRIGSRNIKPNLISNQRSELGKNIFNRLNKSNNHIHVKNLYKNIKQDEMLSVLLGREGGGYNPDISMVPDAYKESVRRRNSEEFRQLFKVSDFFEDLVESYSSPNKPKGFRRDSSLIINQSLNEDVAKFLADELKKFNLVFEHKLDSLIKITNSESEDLWGKLRNFKTVSTNSIPEYSDTIISHLIKQAIKNIFEKFLSNNQLENLNNIYILKLCLPYITQDLFKQFLIILGEENQDIISVLKKEKIEIDETWISDNLKSGFGFDASPIMTSQSEILYHLGKLKKNDTVFISLDKDMYGLIQEPKQKINFPIEIKTVSFLSGVLTRNSSDNRSIVSSFTPIGFHGGKLATELYNNSNEPVAAPIPRMIEIFENDKIRSLYLDENQVFNSRGLNKNLNDKSNFSTTLTLRFQINNWMNYLKLGKYISISRDNKLGSSSISLKTESASPGSRFEELYNLGSGVSQALPIISHILLSENKTIFLEEIEQNLHASAQAALADMILLLSLDKSRNFVIETHSEHIINRLRLRTLQLSKGKYPYQDENPYNIYFAIKKKNGTKLTKMRIGEAGNFIDDYPEGFFDQAQLDILKIISEAE